MASRPKPVRVFVSHASEDAPALAKAKNALSKFGFQCFLAHDDIEPGDDYTEAIEQELQECDVFLYVGSKDAAHKAFCQQEVGMAKGLDKPILAFKAKDASPPAGFIRPMQAIIYREIDDNFSKQIAMNLMKLRDTVGPDEIKKHLKITGITGFSTTGKPGTLHLEANTYWNDHDYKTMFDINVNNKRVGYVRIGYNGQSDTSSHSARHLPEFFDYLTGDLLSQSFFYSQNEFNSCRQASIKYLLNDTTLMDGNEHWNISNEPVYLKSLRRTESPDDPYRGNN